MEQGIWNNNCTEFAFGNWKHEEPLDIESESTNNLGERSSNALFSFSRPPKSDEDKRRDAELRAARIREREASRPFHQFVYQLSKERERITEQGEGEEGVYSADINTTAYENVKSTWIKRKIWNQRWGTIPGMSWNHEEPLVVAEEEATESPPTPLSQLVNGNQEATRACTLFTFGSAENEPNHHHQPSDASNSTY